MKRNNEEINEDPYAPGAQFNSGVATAMEIRKLLSECNLYSRTGRFDLWYSTLLVLIRESCPETKYGSNEDDIDKAAREALVKLGDFKPGINLPMNKQNEIFISLHKLEIEIRRALKHCGLTMPDKDDDDGL